MSRLFVIVFLVSAILFASTASAGPARHHNGNPILQPPSQHGHHLSPIERANRTRWIYGLRQIGGILRYQTPAATWQARSALDGLIDDVRRTGEPSSFNRDLSRRLRYSAMQLQGVHSHFQVSQQLYELDVMLWRSLNR